MSGNHSCRYFTINWTNFFFFYSVAKYLRNKSCRLLFMTDKWILDKEGNLCTVHSACAVLLSTTLLLPITLLENRCHFHNRATWGDQTAIWSAFKIFSASNNTIIRTSWKYHSDILKGEAENTQRNLDLPSLFYPISFIFYMCRSFVTQSICSPCSKIQLKMMHMFTLFKNSA